MRYWRRPPEHKILRDDVALRRLVRSRDAPPPPTNADTSYEVKVSCLADLDLESVDWLWGTVIPLGKVTTLTGDAGIGKTLLTLNIAADVTRGQGASGQSHDEQPGNVLLISSAADLADVVGPRLIKAGADLARVQALRGVKRRNPNSDDQACWLFQLNQDLRLLELEIARQKADDSELRLIIIDPFPTEMFAGTQGATNLTLTVQHLAEIAAWSQTAIVLVATTAVHGGATSAKIVRSLETMVDSAWTIVKDFDHPERGLLLPVKANLTESPAGMSFTVQDDQVVWEPEPVHMTAEQFRAESLERTRTPLFQMEWSELARATDWLQRYLQSKTIPQRLIKQEAAANDISYRTLQRAFCGLRGIARRIDNSRFWEWSLPSSNAKHAPIPHWCGDGDTRE